MDQVANDNLYKYEGEQRHHYAMSWCDLFFFIPYQSLFSACNQLILRRYPTPYVCRTRASKQYKLKYNTFVMIHWIESSPSVQSKSIGEKKWKIHFHAIKSGFINVKFCARSESPHKVPVCIHWRSGSAIRRYEFERHHFFLYDHQTLTSPSLCDNVLNGTKLHRGYIGVVKTPAEWI